MVSIAGLGFAQGLASFAENKRQAEMEREKAKSEAAAKAQALKLQQSQEAYYNALAAEKNFAAQQSLVDILGDEPPATSPKETPTPPASSDTGQQDKNLVQPYDAGTGVSLGFDQQQPSYVRGKSLPTELSSMEPMGEKKLETPKVIAQRAVDTAGGMGASAGLGNIGQPATQFFNPGDYGDIPQSRLDSLNGYLNQMQNINKYIEAAGPAKEYLKQFRGKPLPTPDNPEYAKFMQNFSIAKQARVAPAQLNAIRNAYTNEVVSGIGDAIGQKNFKSASELASKIGYTNQFKQSKSDKNMVDVLAPDGKTVLQTLPFTLVQQMFSSEKKELNAFVADTVKSNTDFANQKIMESIRNANANQRAVLHSLNPVWKVGTHYAIDTKGLFSGIKGAAIPIVAGDKASKWHPLNENSPMHKIAIANGWIRRSEDGKSWITNDGKLVPYDKNDMKIFIPGTDTDNPN